MPPSELAAALAKVQAELPSIRKTEKGKVEGVSKTGKPYSYEYDYADLTGVSEAILPLLGANGLAFIAKPTLVDGSFALAYSLLHTSGEREDGVYPLADRGTPQDLGKYITYARRYALCAVTGVAPGGEDNDAAEGKELHMDRSQRRGPERYTGWDRPSETPVRGPRPGPEHEQLRTDPPSESVWDGEDHWVDQPPGPPIANGKPERPRRGNGKLSPAQAIAVHFKRLGVTDDTERLVKTTILAGLTDLLGSTNDLDEAKQRQIGDELAKCRDRTALAALVAAHRAEVPS